MLKFMGNWQSSMKRRVHFNQCSCQETGNAPSVNRHLKDLEKVIAKQSQDVQGKRHDQNKGGSKPNRHQKDDT